MSKTQLRRAPPASLPHGLQVALSADTAVKQAQVSHEGRAAATAYGRQHICPVSVFFSRQWPESPPPFLHHPPQQVDIHAERDTYEKRHTGLSSPWERTAIDLWSLKINLLKVSEAAPGERDRFSLSGSL